VIYFAPETRLGLGAYATLVFKLNKNDTISRKSNVQPYFIYTINKQILSSIGYTLFFNHENYRTEGEFFYNYFPENYYGIGNNLSGFMPDIISYNWIKISNKTTRKVANGLVVGLNYDFVNMCDLKGSAGGLLETTKPTGYDGSVISGIGTVLTYDTKDNVLNASNGWYADLSTTFYSIYFGSQYEFQKVKIVVRYYNTVWKKLNQVLALQLFAQFIPGDVPFKHLSKLGGDVIMRGYYTGRYRDHHYVAFQAEYRIPIW